MILLIGRYKSTSYCRQQKKFNALPITQQEALKREKAQKRKERVKVNDGKPTFVIKKRKWFDLKKKKIVQKQKTDDYKKPSANRNNNATEDEGESCSESIDNNISESCSQKMINSPISVRESSSEVDKTEDEIDE